jgi:hypothetical protein
MSVDLRKSRDINNALTAVLNCVEMEEERHAEAFQRAKYLMEFEE